MTGIGGLGIFSGQPAFREPLHVGRPNIGDRRLLFERIERALDGRWLTNDGPNVIDFERLLADRLGVKHCIATCNATVGLMIAARAAGLAGDVLIPSFTFVATAHALRWQGINPIFCDIDPKSFTLQPESVERRLTADTTGIVGVHIWGRACDVDALAQIAARHGCKLLFDAAHGFGCSYRGTPVGSFGTAEVMSFHATKVVNTFEGGAILTNDDEIAGKARLMKQFGFAGYDSVVELGINGKMDEIAAAMGIASLASAERIIAANASHYQRYRDSLADLPGVTVLPYPEGEATNYHYIVLEIDARAAGLTRDELLQTLWADRILARRYFYPGCHRLEPYRSEEHDLALPNTNAACEQVLQLPTGTALTANDVERICLVVRMAVERAGEVKARLATLGKHPDLAGP